MAQWNEWVEAQSYERLLSAAYVLDSYHALLLVRSSHATAQSGLELYLPTANSIWEAQSARRWAQLLRSAPTRTMSVFQVLEEIECNPGFRLDSFQSAVIVASYAAYTSHHSQDPYAIPLFDIANHEVLGRALCDHTCIRIMHQTVRLIACTPLRALIATSGESWFFSKRLANEAHIAAEEFKYLKFNVRNWTMPSDLSSQSRYAISITSALEIIKIAMTAADRPHATLAFGPELGLYFASLVMWASTFAGLSRAEACGHSFPRDDETAEFEPPRAEGLVRNWLPLAPGDIHTAIAAGSAAPGMQVYPDGTIVHCQIPPLENLDSWRRGVGSVIRWSAWVLGGASHRSSGAGELIEGAVGVLEKLGRSGWEGAWF
jgi:hypothetical protein